jgi:hypothetical protein
MSELGENAKNASSQMRIRFHVKGRRAGGPARCRSIAYKSAVTIFGRRFFAPDESNLAPGDRATDRFQMEFARRDLLPVISGGADNHRTARCVRCQLLAIS